MSFAWPFSFKRDIFLTLKDFAFIVDDSALVSDLRILPVSLHGFFVDILIAWTDLCIGNEMVCSRFVEFLFSWFVLILQFEKRCFSFVFLTSTEILFVAALLFIPLIPVQCSVVM